jgi:NADPH2:quinone reductase
MKAIVVHQYGGPEVLKFEECPDPVAGSGEVLVRVAAAAASAGIAFAARGP